MIKILRIFGILPLLGAFAAICSPALAFQLQVSGGAPYMCAVVQGGDTASGTPVIAYPCSGGPEDQWNWVNGEFRSIGTANGSYTCLDVNRTLAVLSSCNANSGGGYPDAPTWYFESDLTGSSQIHFNGLGHGCLDSFGGPSVGGGTQLVVAKCNGAASQNWTVRGMQIQAAGNAPYLCANVQGSKTADGTPVLAYSCDDAPNELWNIQKAQIVGVGAENSATKCLVASAASDGSLVSLSTCSGTTANSQWGIGYIPVTLTMFNPGAIILSPGYFLCLDRSGGPSVGGGTQLVVHYCSTAASQIWVLR